MEKNFWVSIQENDYTIPGGHSVLPLTDELFSYLGSTDAELRDTIGLEVFYNWLKQGLYNHDYLRDLITRLMSNLQIGLGETESDSVFLRSFSALWLGLIVNNDHETLAIERKEIASILAAALAYFTAESDLRGYVPFKGYAHAIAHGADLLGALANSLHTDANDHLKILNCIANKLNKATQGIYLYNEDSRIARTVTNIFLRNTLTLEQIRAWLAALENEWHGAWQNEKHTRAYNNGRNCLRSLYLYILMLEGDQVPHEEKILKLVQETLGQAKPWDQLS